MVGYGLKLAGALIALLLIGVILVLIFNALWFRIGLGAAFVLLFGVIALLAWNTDRKNKAKRAGLPPV